MVKKIDQSKTSSLMEQAPRAAAQDEVFESFPDFFKGSVYQAFPQEHREGGSFGQKFLRADQDAIDFVDSPVPDFIVTLGATRVRDCVVDIGDGAFHTADAEPGTFCIYPANADARTSIAVPHTIMNFSMPREQVDAWLDEAGVDYDPFAAMYGRLHWAVEPQALLKAMWRAAHAPAGTDHLLIDGLTLQFLSDLAAQGRERLSMADFSGHVDRRVARAVEYIEAHLAAPFGVAELAAVACLSPTHFARAFKATIGETVWAFVRRRRAERARELLVGSDEPIDRVSQLCGFADASHLSRVIKASFDVTPGKLRRAARR